MPGRDSEQTAIFHWDTSRFLHSGPSLNKPLRSAKQGGLIHRVSFFHGVWGASHGEKQQQLFAKCLLLPEPHGRHSTFNLSLIIKRPPRKLPASLFTLGTWVSEGLITLPRITQLRRVGLLSFFFFCFFYWNIIHMPLNSSLKCTVQWVLYSHGGVIFPLSNFIIPPKKPIPWHHSHSHPHLWQSLVYFLSPWICPFGHFLQMEYYTKWPFVSGFTFP